MPLLPPSSRIERPKRSPTVMATRLPTPVEPVNEIIGMRRSVSMRLPTSRPEPITSDASAPKPSASSTGRTTLVSAIAHSGVSLDGFHTTESPHT
jgi:hypothetical protein